MPTEHVVNMECRKAVREYLALRPGIAMEAAAIARGLKHQGAFELERVKYACQFLQSRGHAQELTDPDGGGEKYYRITAEGTVAYENGN